MGIHIQVDELLFHCAHRGGLLSPLLQLSVHQLAVDTAAENRPAVVQLRGHFDESVGVACDTKATHQSDAAQRLQGQGEREVSRVFGVLTF